MNNSKRVYYCIKNSGSSKRRLLHGVHTEFSCVTKEAVDIGILVTSRNGDRKVMQWRDPLSQFRRTSTKVIPTEKT